MHKTILVSGVGIIGASVASLFGGWDAGLQALCVFLGLDFLFGLTVALTGKSPKSESGGLNSQSAWWGLLRKSGTLGIVVGANFVDKTMGTHFVRDAVVISYIVSEGISLAENAALLGIKFPAPLMKAFDVLSKKADKPGEEE